MNINKTDVQLQKDIETELRWEPRLNAAQIGVTVEKGAVTLLGTVDTYAEKWAAETAVKRVAGVRTLAQDLTVKLISEHARTDSEIATAIQSALSWDVFVPKTVTAKVEHGMVTLEGKCAWNYERESAERAVRYLAGVVSVMNLVIINPSVSAASVKEKVEAALQRQATKDASNIHITTTGGTVTLTGHASSWRMLTDAADAAWAAPGVTEVVDQLSIG